MPLIESLRREPRPRVAVLRALQAGDMLCAVPALRALRWALPHAHVTLVGLPWAERRFVQRHASYLDGFIAFPGHPGLPEQPADPAAYAAFRERVRAVRFDALVQMHGDGCVTNGIAAELGARRIAGFRKGDDGRVPATDFLEYPDHGAEIRRLTALARFLGAPDAGEHLEYPILPADEAELAAWPTWKALGRGPGYICLHAGARAAERRWPARSFARIGDALHAETGCDIVLTGSPPEKPITTAVAAAMRAPARDAALPISLGALAVLLRGARLVVTNDTGVSHVAAALRVPSVVIFRASDRARWAPLNAGLHPAVWDPEGTREAEVLAHARSLLRSASERAA
jgi:ADP-heptose:LPS heptosyltransferase